MDEGRIIQPRYGLFFGCLISNRFPGIEQSARKVIERLGCNDMFTNLPQAACCPAPDIFYSVDKATWLALAARNLCQAEYRGLEIVTFCNGCLTTLLRATEYLSDPKTLGDVNKVLRRIRMKYSGVPGVTPEGKRVLEPVKVRHFIDMLQMDIGVDAIKAAVTNPLRGLKIAAHCGCHYLRPTSRSTIEGSRNPYILDEICEALGAESVDFQDKLGCCGAGGGLRAHGFGLASAISKTKYECIESAGADCIVTPCPFCLLQLDTIQGEFEGRKIPVLHVAQLVALAIGVDKGILGLDLHRVSADQLFSRLGRG
ncbi:MAG: heterodisulfide reductase-related iron-sulfur binding cluster [Methanomassiliicoccales archaeon]|nr:heterodisulfide reductase-related iron-sulfur binding cluster [Methanomassiliicoccales archaeon]